jgi:enoyl-CoA hydratase
MGGEEPSQVLVEQRDAAHVVTLHRPAARNAINAAMREELITLLRAADSDDKVAVVILTGTDPVFCAGADLKESLNRAEPAGRPRTTVPQVLRAMAKPVICAVNGPCVTGALEVALSCTFIIASDRARFADTHARIGVLPGWGLSALLPRAVGIRKAREMTITGNFVDAAEALRVGLVNEVIPHEQLLDRALALAADIASAHAGAVRASLALYAQGEGAPLAQALGLEAETIANYEVDRDSARSRFGDTIRRGSSSE